MKKSLVGVILVLLGTLFLLRNFDLLPDLPPILTSWPMVFIVIALVQLVSGKPRLALIFGLIGGFFLLQQQDWIDMRMFWPVLLILIGLVFLFRRKREKISDDHHSFSETNIFAGSDKKITSKAFKSGTSTSLFGGTEIDLREAQLDSPAELDVSVIFGGCEIRVPEGWQIKNEITAILGGFSDERKGRIDEDGPELVLRGLAMFGGVEVKD